jgi:hypothetical protein
MGAIARASNAEPVQGSASLLTPGHGLPVDQLALALHAFLNVTNSFIRRQVNARSGAVEEDGSTVVVTSVSDATISREYYCVLDSDSFVYSIDLSNDGGETWNRGSIEFTMNRVE